MSQQVSKAEAAAKSAADAAKSAEDVGKQPSTVSDQVQKADAASKAAEQAAATATAEAKTATVSTEPFTLPPPAVGLILTLKCPATKAPKPTVNAVAPSHGPSYGGNTVEISGTGLTRNHLGARGRRVSAANT